MGRLFVGTFLQPAERDELAALPADYPQLEQLVNRKIRWVKPKKLHMTWIFLGNVEESKISSVIREFEKCVGQFRAKQNGQPALEIAFDLPTLWPNKKEPRHFVLAATEPSENFLSLASTIRQSLKQFGDSDQEEKFRPHVTLLRVDSHPVDPRVNPKQVAWSEFAQTVIDAASQVTPLHLSLDRIDLIESHLGQGADAYESLFSLATSAI